MERIAIKTILEKEGRKPFKKMPCEIDAYRELDKNVFLLQRSKVGSQRFQPALIDENKRIYFTLRKGNRLQGKKW